jgi:hypothetical protein
MSVRLFYPVLGAVRPGAVLPLPSFEPLNSIYLDAQNLLNCESGRAILKKERGAEAPRPSQGTPVGASDGAGGGSGKQPFPTRRTAASNKTAQRRTYHQRGVDCLLFSPPFPGRLPRAYRTSAAGRGIAISARTPCTKKSGFRIRSTTPGTRLQRTIGNGLRGLDFVKLLRILVELGIASGGVRGTESTAL